MSVILNKHTCAICVKQVLDSEKGLQCDSLCDRWFHAVCVDITESEYNKLASDSRRKWNCGRTDCLGADQHPTSLLLSQMGEILNKLDGLSSLPADISTIKNDIAAINSAISTLEPRISDVEKRVELIEQEVNTLRASKPESNTIETVLEETADRTRRAHNVLLHGVPESNSKIAASRIKHDNDLATNMIEMFLQSAGPHPFKTLRLGGVSSKKPRPLKIIFEKVADVADLIKNFSKEVLSQSLANVNISRDRTPIERKFLNDLRAELKKRVDAGERSLTIRYRNGVPRIVSAPSKN